MLHWWRQKPDLIYVNQGGILRPIAAVAKRLRIPILCQIQTLEDAGWVGSLAGCHQSVSTFVCNSEFVATHCRIPPERISTVYQGYKHKHLRKPHSNRARADGKLEVGLLGRICEGKGHYLVVEAAQQLRESVASGFHFRFIGDAASPREQERIESLLKERALGSLITLRGYRSDIAAEFAELDLLVIPSAAEPFGRILCEAVEAHIPVLLADSGGLGEIARRFNVGLRFAPGNTGEFVQRLQWIAGNYDAVRAEFISAGERMLRALDLPSYLAVMSDLIRQAAAGVPVSTQWLGKSDSQTQDHGNRCPLK